MRVISSSIMSRASLEIGSATSVGPLSSDTQHIAGTNAAAGYRSRAGRPPFDCSLHLGNCGQFTFESKLKGCSTDGGDLCATHDVP